MQQSAEDKQLIARAEDAVDLAERRYMQKTVGFLNPRQRHLIETKVVVPETVKAVFFGGYAEAERTMLICCPAYEEPDITGAAAVLLITGRDIAGLSHRDYLGSLMGLGITRENIGDIVVEEERAVLFVRREMSGYILQNLTRIGRCGIKIEETALDTLVIQPKAVEEIRQTVSSLRLDCVVAAAIHVSRARAAEMIEGELVSLNFEVCSRVSAHINEGDLLSVRGYGRMRLASIGGLTRKNRQGIVILRYL